LPDRSTPSSVAVFGLKNGHLTPANTVNNLASSAPQTPLIDPESSNFLDRWAVVILAILGLLLPLMVYGAVNALKVQSSDLRQWLPQGYEESKIYDQFKARFGEDEMIVASWEDCKIDNPAVLDLQEKLSAISDDEGPVFNRVTSGAVIRSQIMASGASREVATRRLSGLMVGADGETTCLIAFPKVRIADKRRWLVDRFYEVAQEELGLDAKQLHLGGPTVDGAAIDTESQKALRNYLWLCLVTVSGLAWYRLRDIPLTALVLIFSGICVGASLTTLYFTGGKMNLTMVMLPAIVFVLGVSGSIHMVNYYRKASAKGAKRHSALVAIRDACFPVLLSSFTTAIGLASLASSQIKPIQHFGIYSALGVLISVPIVLLALPATLHLFKGRISRRFSTAGDLEKRERVTGVSRSMSILINYVCRYNQLIVVPSLIALTLLGTGILNLSASVKLQNRFSSKAKIIQDYQWLESHLGPLVPMEIMLYFSPESDLTHWQEMQMVQSIERAVKQTTAVNATWSAATFEPPTPRGRRLPDVIARKATIDYWQRELPQLEKAKLLKRVGDATFWRISLRVAALNDIDYGSFLKTVEQNVENQLSFMDQHGVSAQITGGIPLIYKAQRQILSDLMVSFVTAFVLITFVLIFVLRSIRAGLIAMVPNIFPPVVVFGTMGWLGYSIEIGSVMTASVALGVAVDDTIHFLTWFRRGTKNGLSRYASIRFAFQHCAKAMIDTSLICGLGVCPFLFSIFMPTAKFALMMGILLLTALVGDLFLLPAILAGSAGKLFAKKNFPKRLLKK
jgi:predicted RND superfamily exporter protein